jgi:hypothetical protein
MPYGDYAHILPQSRPIRTGLVSHYFGQLILKHQYTLPLNLGEKYELNCAVNNLFFRFELSKIKHDHTGAKQDT